MSDDRNEYMKELKESLIDFERMQVNRGPAGDVVGFDGNGALKHSEPVRDVVTVLERLIGFDGEKPEAEQVIEESKDSDIEEVATGEGPGKDKDPKNDESGEKDLGNVASTKGEGQSATPGTLPHGEQPDSYTDTIMDQDMDLIEKLFEDDDLNMVSENIEEEPEIQGAKAKDKSAPKLGDDDQATNFDKSQISNKAAPGATSDPIVKSTNEAGDADATDEDGKGDDSDSEEDDKGDEDDNKKGFVPGKKGVKPDFTKKKGVSEMGEKDAQTREYGMESSDGDIIESLFEDDDDDADYDDGGEEEEFDDGEEEEPESDMNDDDMGDEGEADLSSEPEEPLEVPAAPEEGAMGEAEMEVPVGAGEGEDVGDVSKLDLPGDVPPAEPPPAEGEVPEAEAPGLPAEAPAAPEAQPPVEAEPEEEMEDDFNIESLFEEEMEGEEPEAAEIEGPSGADLPAEPVKPEEMKPAEMEKMPEVPTEAARMESAIKARREVEESVVERLLREMENYNESDDFDTDLDDADDDLTTDNLFDN